MSSRTKALIAIVISSLLWSSAGLAKIVVQALDPYSAAFLRFFVASIVMLPFFLRENNRGKHILRDLVPLSLLLTANIACYYIGLMSSTANAAALIYAGLPLVTAILAHRFIHEQLTVKRLMGIVIGLCGVILIALLPVLEKDAAISGSLWGNTFFVIAILVFPWYTVGSRRAITILKYSPVTLTSVSLFTTTIVFFCISLFTFRSENIPHLLQPSIILLSLYLGILVTAATYLLYQWAVKYSSATTAALGSYLQPVFAVILNIIFLHEAVTPLFLLGGIIVLAGVVIAGGTNVVREVRGWIRW
jgi:drug/metabolite transporter (DMT)-like permease